MLKSFFNRFLSLCLLFSITGCNIGGNRFPANDFRYEQTDEPVAFVQIKLSSIERGLRDIFSRSPIVRSLERFHMDPVTRILNVKLIVDYPLENLFNFTEIPENQIPNEHEIEFSVSFPETKTLAQTRYLGLTFHKFNIDGDEYLNAFDVVAGVTKTILANSELVDFLYKEFDENLPADDHRIILQEILDENGIVVFHTTRKINFKLDLSKVSQLSPYAADYENLRLWRFSPTLFQGQEVRFKIIAGEGRPTDRWLTSEEADITEDTRTLLQVRTDLYQEFSDIRNLETHNQNYLQSLLSNENIVRNQLRNNYQTEISQFLIELRQRAQENLARGNENFLADPEYEYLQNMEYAQARIRTFVSNLDRRLTIDDQILSGGVANSRKKPLVRKLISQDLLNSGANFLIDLELEGGHQLFTEAQLWLLPQTPGVSLKGRVHLPLEYLLGQMNSTLIGQEIESKISENETGYPIELVLESRMADSGVLGLEIKELKIESAGRTLNFDRNSENQNFLFDLTKLFLANTLSAIKFETEESSEESQTQEVSEIISYLSELRNSYTGNRQRDLEALMLKDILFNPYIASGQEHLERKREILLGQVFSYNENSKLFEMKLDPNLVMDKIHNVRHNLQVWSVTPLFSRELNSTFLEMTVGAGLRPQSFIDDLYFRGGNAENSEFSGIYYELGEQASSVDMLFTLNFSYLKNYLNNFLREIVQVNAIDIERQAEENPGERFFEVEQLSVDITSDKTILLDLKIKTAVYGRTFRSLGFSRAIKTDTYSLQSELQLESKTVNIGSNQTLVDLRYFPQAISVVPRNVRIASGSPSWINRALTSMLSNTSNLILNSGTFKRLLLKLVNSHLNKMYSSQDQQILGHPIEKIARIHTTANDILIFPNPKLAGPAFDIHLASQNDPVKNSLKLDAVNQMMHIALTSGSTMAKQDKKDLIELVKLMKEIMNPIDTANTKEELQAVLADQQLVGKLITNTDREKLSVYQKYLSIMRKYDQVLHTATIPHQNELKRTRITSSGSELMYFAGVAFKLKEKLDGLITKMNRLGVNGTNSYYPTFVEARGKIENNIYRPLLSQYQRKNHQINKTIVSNKVSYWTYQTYPDAYLAEEIYKIIKN